MDQCVSIVIPTFNRGDLLRRALLSVLEQTIPQWECIVVDDASTEDIGGAVARTAAHTSPLDTRIRIERLARRSGNTVARAIGCAQARGKYIAVLDSDDWWHPQKLERQVTAMERDPDAVICLHAIEAVDETGTVFFDPVHPREHFLRDLLKYNFSAHGSFFMRRDAYQAVGGYDRRLPRSSDWDLLIRLTLKYGEDRILPLPDMLAYWWIHDKNISADGRPRAQAERAIVRRLVLNRALLLRRPRLALQMIDGQLDREMHALAGDRWALACAVATFSALCRPFRLWRWRRAWRFTRAAASAWYSPNRPVQLRQAATCGPKRNPFILSSNRPSR
jgi:glycosyltransferase involved in cell wall biosynthesis